MCCRKLKICRQDENVYHSDSDDRRQSQRRPVSRYLPITVTSNSSGILSVLDRTQMPTELSFANDFLPQSYDWLKNPNLKMVGSFVIVGVSSFSNTCQLVCNFFSVRKQEMYEHVPDPHLPIHTPNFPILFI